MTNILLDLVQRGMIRPPKFVAEGAQYITVMGSMAYGVSSDSSDEDIYGFCMPSIRELAPHTQGNIQGFGTQIEPFQQYQQHHVIDSTENGGTGKEYDFTIYSIVKYFNLCMGGNPNMIDSLFTRHNMVKYSSSIGDLVRDNRHLFLSKIVWSKFKGYAYSQHSKMTNKAVKQLVDFEKAHGLKRKYTLDDIGDEHIRRKANKGRLRSLSNDDLDVYLELMQKFSEVTSREDIARLAVELYRFEANHKLKGRYSLNQVTQEAYLRTPSTVQELELFTLEDLQKYENLLRLTAKTGKRMAGIEKYGLDLKFAYHIVRLLNEVEQILTEGDLDLMRSREQLKSIRNGEWKLKEIEDYFTSKQKQLEEVYTKSKLPDNPREDEIRQLLFDCMEEYYGSLSNIASRPDASQQCLNEIQAALDKYNLRVSS